MAILLALGFVAAGCGGGGGGAGGSNSGTGSRPTDRFGNKLPLPGVTTGGVASGPDLPTADLYYDTVSIAREQGGNPNLGNMTVARVSATATSLPSGKVLIVGGSQGNAALNTAETYDQATGQFERTVDGRGVVVTMRNVRRLHTATINTAGNVVIVGGMGQGNDILGTIEEYHPSTGEFVNSNAVLREPRAGHTSTLLPTGELLIVGGIKGTVGAVAPGQQGFRGWQATSLVEIYDPATGKLNSSTILPRNPAQSLPQGQPASLNNNRAFHAACPLPSLNATGRVGVFGGLGDSGGTTSASGFPANNNVTTIEVFDYATNRWTSLSTSARRVFGHAIPVNQVTDRNGIIHWDVLLCGGVASPFGVNTFVTTPQQNASERDDGKGGPVGIMELFELVDSRTGPQATLLTSNSYVPAVGNKNPNFDPTEVGSSGTVAVFLGAKPNTPNVDRVFMAGGVVWVVPPGVRVYSAGGVIAEITGRRDANDSTRRTAPPALSFVEAGQGQIPSPNQFGGQALTMHSSRSFAVAARLPGFDGRFGTSDDTVLIAGGESDNSQPLNSAEVYFPQFQ
ncbi:MAG: hypothetical protein HY722_05800 [Planctomycetes bacterium]|nr:hypothetical protein [Planctomycetota bacterium]